MTDTAVKRGIYNCPNCGAAATPESVKCAYCTCILATRVCPACFGAIFINMRHCPWCGTRSSDAEKIAERALQCPRCSTGMDQLELGGKRVRRCAPCGGLWVDKDTLQEICNGHEDQEAVLGFNTAPTGADAVGKAPRVYVACPECGKLMNRRNFAGCSGVIVDWCKTHGCWFDHNELRRIVLFIRDGGLRKARMREKARLEEEKLHLRDQKRNLARLSRMAGESPRLDSAEDPDLFLGLLGGIWKGLGG